MKKKNLVVKGMAMLMACALVVGNTGIVAHATDDGAYHGDGRENGGSSPSDGSDDIGGGSSSSGDSGSSSSGGGSSYSEPSYDDGAYHGNGRENGGSSPSDGSDNIGGGSSASSYSAPKAAGTTTGVTGKENFRALAKSGSGTYKVTHKGIDIATFTLMDAESKKAVPCTAVTLKQRTDGKWAIDFQVTVKNAETTEAADTTGLTVGAPLDRTYMYTTLGVSYVTINDNIVIDIEAEAAAK